MDVSFSHYKSDAVVSLQTQAVERGVLCLGEKKVEEEEGCLAAEATADVDRAASAAAAAEGNETPAVNTIS